MNRDDGTAAGIRTGGLLVAYALVLVLVSACKSDWQPPPIIPTDDAGQRTSDDRGVGADVTEWQATRTPPPDVLPRTKWFALPIDATNANLMEPISRLTVHHTGEPEHWSGQELAEAGRRMGVYQKWHVERRGWADIAYHYVIDPAGRIWEGRLLRWQGAHAGNHETNRGNVGVCLMGNFEIGTPTDAQRASLAALVAWFVREYELDVNEIYTHKGIKAKYGLPGTACPGRTLAVYVDELRADVLTAVSSVDHD